MANMFDIGIIGSGVAGAFALKKILSGKKKLKIAVFDAGRPPLKRRHQLYGFLGCLPGSDGKLYVNDFTKVSHIAGPKKTNSASKWVLNQLSDICSMKLIKDKSPSISAKKRMAKNGFDLELNNYYQLFPKDIHTLSRNIVKNIDTFGEEQVFMSFDNEVFNIEKIKNYFNVVTNDGEYQCKNILISVGRGGWRWVSELFSNFGIIENNDTAKFGIRVEIPSSYMKDFNQSNCTLSHSFVEIGPICHNGTIIPEDHIDLAITAFRSNEARWKSDKVSFNIMAEKHFENQGYQQVDRIGKLTFILSNDRVMKERLSTIMNKKSKISVMHEYDWLIQELSDIEDVIPNIIESGSFYVPTIYPSAPKINIQQNFETDIKGLYVAGETASVPGLYGAALSGTIVGDILIK